MGWENKISPSDFGHMTKMATMPVCVNNTPNTYIFFSRISGRIDLLR